MKKSGIHHKDILIVDRSVTARHGSIVITSVDQEPSIRRFVRQGAQIFLVSDDMELKPITITEETEWTIWGVVTHVIHRFKLGNERHEI